MKRLIKFLQPKDVLLLHNLVIETSGGSHGISNYKEFEAAVHAPFATFVGQEMYPTIIEKAAALMFAFMTKTVFLDKKGEKEDVNEKTALLAGITFLELNGYQFNADSEEVAEFLKSTRKEKKTIDQIVEWLQSNSSRRKN